MPFSNDKVFKFDRATIEWLSPNQGGVYGLYVASKNWVYVGKGDIRARLLAHLNGDNPCITGQRPTHFLTEVTPSMDAREKELILELNPSCNRRVG